MTERERLIELLKVPIYPKIGVDPAELVADYLLDNGIIVSPCKVGDKVYRIIKIDNSKIKPFITDEKIVGISPIYRNVMGGLSDIDVEEFGKTVFLTREEAEKALEEREKKENEN